MAIEFINLNELLENIISVINLKILLNVIKKWGTTWISCDSLHAWLLTQSLLIGIFSRLF